MKLHFAFALSLFFHGTNVALAHEDIQSLTDGGSFFSTDIESPEIHAQVEAEISAESNDAQQVLDAVFAPAHAGDVPVIPEVTAEELVDEGEIQTGVALLDADSALPQVTERPLQKPELPPAASVSESLQADVTPVVHLKKDRGQGRILPKKSVVKMSDQELRDLCEVLKSPNPHTMETVDGSQLENFNIKAPLIMRVDRMKALTNVQGQYVVLVGRVNPAKNRAKVDLLKDVKKPHIFCGVQAGKIEGIKGKLIFVGVNAPAALKKHPQVRSIKQL